MFHDIEALSRGKFKLDKDTDTGELSMRIDYRRKFQLQYLLIKMESIIEKTHKLDWDYPNPFTVSIQVSDQDIDQLGHANNQVYLDWMMKAAYGHSESLGLSVNDYLSIGVAMVAKRHEINYMSATFLNDDLIVGTWIATNDNRFQSMRKYQIIRTNDKKTILRAETDWVSLNIDNGKPQRMPDEFIRCYQPTIR